MIEDFKQAFREEARDILGELESSLLELNNNPSDSEIVGKAFRALHTLKGSGAMFGFEKLARFSHRLENAFDEVRNGRLTVTSELINLSLSALDEIKAMLNEVEGSEISSAGADEIVGRLERLTGKAEVNTPPPNDSGRSDANHLERSLRLARALRPRARLDAQRRRPAAADTRVEAVG